MTENDSILQLEAHLDHLTGEELAFALEAIMDSGALDVLWMPGIMKKGRPGGALRVLCREEQLEQVQAAFFRHTHTLGIRQSRIERVILPRQATTVTMNGQEVAAKAYTVDGQEYYRPEYEAMAAHARKKGTSVIGMRVGTPFRK